MANCCNCAAPLPATTLVCEYCGSRNDVDLAAIHYNTTHECETPRFCPRCGVVMQTIDLKIGGKFLIERCAECFGLFFDPGELDALLDAEVRNVFEVNRSRIEALDRSPAPSGGDVRYLKCPVCSNFMNRVNFGAKSGVVVDRCREHGVWLDGGELRRLFEWTRAGGRLLDQEKREESKKEEARQRSRPERGRPADAPEPWYTGTYPEYGGGTVPYRERDLYDLLRDVVHLILH